MTIRHGNWIKPSGRPPWSLFILLIVVLLLRSKRLLRSIGLLILHCWRTSRNSIRWLMIQVRCYCCHRIVWHLVNSSSPFSYCGSVGLLFLLLWKSRMRLLRSTSQICYILYLVDLQVVIDSLADNDQVLESQGGTSNYSFEIKPLKGVHEHVYQFSFKKMGLNPSS